jgi:hypothetical protein
MGVYCWWIILVASDSTRNSYDELVIGNLVSGELNQLDTRFGFGWNKPLFMWLQPVIVILVILNSCRMGYEWVELAKKTDNHR